MRKKDKYTVKIAVSAVMLAMSAALSFVTIVKLPLGGSVTLFSMLPLCVISFLYGTKFALAPCFLYGIIEAFAGGMFGWGLSPEILVGSFLFDYVFAFSSMSIAGVFIKKGRKGMCAGTVLACAVRFFCHFISGLIFFRNFDVFSNPVIYSLVYNGSFMSAELLLTVFGVFLISKRLIKLSD